MYVLITSVIGGLGSSIVWEKPFDIKITIITIITLLFLNITNTYIDL